MKTVHVHIFFLILLISSQIFAQYSEYEVKAAYIKNFTIFIDWPEENDIAVSDLKPVKILVLGENPFGKILDQFSSEFTIKERPISVEYKNIPDYIDCDILFICENMKPELSKILSSVKRKPILTISDSEGFALRGVHINFYMDDGSVLFEINRKQLQLDGFQISSRLLNLALLVDGRAN